MNNKHESLIRLVNYQKASDIKTVNLNKVWCQNVSVEVCIWAEYPVYSFLLIDSKRPSCCSLHLTIASSLGEATFSNNCLCDTMTSNCLRTVSCLPFCLDDKLSYLLVGPIPPCVTFSPHKPWQLSLYLLLFQWRFDSLNGYLQNTIRRWTNKLSEIILTFWFNNRLIGQVKMTRAFSLYA